LLVEKRRSANADAVKQQEKLESGNTVGPIALVRKKREIWIRKNLNG